MVANDLSPLSSAAVPGQFKGWVAALVLCFLAAGALAQNTQPARPSGSVNIHQVQIAFIGSGAMGGGTLNFHGRSYPFKLGGLGIGGIGVSTIDAVGSVYNLKRLQDFKSARRLPHR